MSQRSDYTTYINSNFFTNSGRTITGDKVNSGYTGLIDIVYTKEESDGNFLSATTQFSTVGLASTAYTYSKLESDTNFLSANTITYNISSSDYTLMMKGPLTNNKLYNNVNLIYETGYLTTYAVHNPTQDNGLGVLGLRFLGTINTPPITDYNYIGDLSTSGICSIASEYVISKRINALTLSGLTDVNLSALTHADVLVYSGGTGEWFNEETVDLSTLVYTKSQSNSNFLSANTSYYTQAQANNNFLSANTSYYTQAQINTMHLLLVNTGATQTITGSKKFGTDIDYSTFENDGTLVFNGSATTYDDIIIYATNLRVGATPPAFDVFLGNIYSVQFLPNVNDEVFGSFEIPHSYKTGSTLEIHVHWSPMTTNVGTVQWEFEYTYAQMSGGTFFTGTTTLSASTNTTGIAYNHQYTRLGYITDSNMNIGAIIQFRLIRNGADTFTGNATLHSIGCHYEQDTTGSRDIARK